MFSRLLCGVHVVDIRETAPSPFLGFGCAFYSCLATIDLLTIPEVNSYAKEVIGLSDIESINFVFITNALGVVARPIFGLIADRYLGPINTFGLNSMALGAMAFAWTGVRTRADMYAFSCVMGFVNGAAQGVFPGAASSLVPDVSKLGSWVGMVFAICGFATLAGPPTMGAIVDASGGVYTWAQIWAGIVIIIGSLALLVAARMVGVRKLKGNAKGKFFIKA
jgi:MCP family monocarboxylic acid transporter-like MFS transporter 3